MHEVFYRNLTSEDKRHAIMSVREVFDTNGLVTTAEKQCVYVIKSVSDRKLNKQQVDYGDVSDVLPPGRKKEFFLVRSHNSARCNDSFSVKVLGDFCCVIESRIYCISFKYTMKISHEKKYVHY